MTDSVGWLATAVFLCSYFARQPTTLRRVQGVAASLWVTYGILIHSWPVIVANILVAGVAVATSLRPASAPSQGG